MLPIFTAQGISLALNIGKHQALKYINKQIDAKMLEQVQLHVEKEINQFIFHIQAKTNHYLALAGFNLIIIIISHFYKDLLPLKYFALLISLTFLSYMSVQSIKSFSKFINYFQNFEEHIKGILVNKLEQAKQENWKNKIALLVNSKEVHDYYLFILDKMINTTSQWIKRNKPLLYLRVILFIFGSFCLSYSFRELIAF